MGLFGNRKKTEDTGASLAFHEEIHKRIAEVKSENDAKPITPQIALQFEGLDDNEYRALRFIRMLVSDRYNLVPRKDMNASFAANIMAEYYNVPVQRGKWIYRKHS